MDKFQNFYQSNMPQNLLKFGVKLVNMFTDPAIILCLALFCVQHITLSSILLCPAKYMYCVYTYPSVNFCNILMSTWCSLIRLWLAKYLSLHATVGVESKVQQLWIKNVGFETHWNCKNEKSLKMCITITYNTIQNFKDNKDI